MLPEDSAGGEMKRDDLYLISIELADAYAYGPRRCVILRRLRNDLRDDFAYVRLDRPIPAGVLDEQRAFRTLILIARHAGDTVFSILKWPLIVNVLDPAPYENHVPQDLSRLRLDVLDWGALYPALSEARSAQGPGAGTR